MGIMRKKLMNGASIVASFLLGFLESLDEVGMTYNDPIMSDAYDYGRTLGRKLCGIEGRCCESGVHDHGSFIVIGDCPEDHKE